MWECMHWLNVLNVTVQTLSQQGDQGASPAKIRTCMQSAPSFPHWADEVCSKLLSRPVVQSSKLHGELSDRFKLKSLTYTWALPMDCSF